MSQLSFTVDTNDTRTVREVAETLLRLSGQLTLNGYDPISPDKVGHDQTYGEAVQDLEQQVESIGEKIKESLDSNPELKQKYEALMQSETELDSEGQPWDERIHSSSRTKIANGTWKLKRGVSDELVAEVKGLGFTPTNGSESTPPQPAEPIVENTPPPPPPPSSNKWTYAGLIQHVTANSIPILNVQAACQAEGIESFPLLAKNPDKIDAVAARLGI